MPTPYDSIPAMNYDLDTGHGGNIYYQNALASDLILIKNKINLVDSSFTPNNAYVITYDQVPDFSTGLLKASFQIILATDSITSYVILQYFSCMSSLRVTPGLYYINQQCVSVLNKIEISTNPCSSSNVNEAGTWILSSFNLTSYIQSPYNYIGKWRFSTDFKNLLFSMY